MIAVVAALQYEVATDRAMGDPGGATRQLQHRHLRSLRRRQPLLHLARGPELQLNLLPADNVKQGINSLCFQQSFNCPG